MTKETRFEFSHEFVHLLLAQMEDHIDGKNISFKIKRKKRSNDDNDVDQWIDCFTYNIIHRPEAIENISAYQQLMEYEISSLGKIKMKQIDLQIKQMRQMKNVKNHYLQQTY